ncbi:MULTISPECIES: SMP-30/gluconolactonase/LRE family protein [Sphingobacteriaceae]|uniref:SMP-30/Gluconolaconase/LRE-like region-containing protein n=1 Tax=Sphingobacterium sp. (strain 21) TaxID=743722 RepID=F4C7F0_SPHS2
MKPINNCTRFVLIVCCLFLYNQEVNGSATPVADSSEIVLAGEQLQLVGDGFAFTEGPAADRDGNVYFTDQPNNRIWKYDLQGKLSIFMENAGRANGLYFDKEGALIACADEQNQLWRIENGVVEKLVRHYQDTLLNGPNDVWVAPNGFIYFTDPYYQRDYWKRKAPDLKVQALYLYKKGGHLVRLDDRFKRPNGIVGTPDGHYLYVADIGDDKTYRYILKKNGKLAKKRLFIHKGSDGMTIDTQGNLYLTGKGVTVYDKQGKEIAHISVPAKWTANVCFGGRDGNILFITASDKVFTLKMRTKGYSK